MDNQIDPTTGTLRLRANFDNTDNSLFPNQFVNVRLLVEEKGGVTLVPSAVIQRTASSTYVYAVNDNRTVSVRQIAEGVTEGDNVEITSGIAPGDVLVMTGVDKLQEGTQVAVQMADEHRLAAADPEGSRSEPVPDIHSPSGCNLAADGGHSAGGCGRLQAVAGLGTCPKWITPPFRWPHSTPAPVRTLWRHRSPRRWNASSARCPACSR